MSRKCLLILGGEALCRKKLKNESVVGEPQVAIVQELWAPGFGIILHGHSVRHKVDGYSFIHFFS